MREPSKKQHMYKRIAMVFVGMFLFFYSTTFLLYPVTVHALPVTEQKQPIEDQVLNAVLAVIMGSLVNMASYFMRTLAYDAATYISSGGQGQGALIFEKPFDEYLADVGRDSIGEAVATIGSEWGLNLCAPPNFELNAQIKIGLDTSYQTPGPGQSGQRPESKCSWQTLQENWKDGPTFDINVDVAADFAGEVNVMQTDFGFVLGGLEELSAFKDAQEEAAKLSRTLNDGFKSVTDPISGFINTPGKLIEEEATALTGKHQGALNAEQTAGMYASELWQIIPTSASIFLNTLTSQLLTRLFTEGIVPSELEKGQGAFDFYAVNAVISKRKVAQKAFGFLTAATGSKDPAEYNIVAEFSACPENPELVGLNNCVMSDGIKKALDLANIGRPLTLWEAVFDEGLISPNMPIINPRSEIENEDRYCYKDKLCYSNIQKMRRARILPLGLEIAAHRGDPDRPWTIEDVLKRFEDCPAAGLDGIAVDHEKYPFCHLVNPNWILRAPQARCENRVYSPELSISSLANRKSECVDVSTCITEDKDGNCTQDNYYGYCTQEKNTWHIPGASCEAQFATCKTFTNQETKEVVSYLTRTLENGSCGPDAVGCRPFVTERVFGTETWIGTQDITIADKLEGRQQVLHFNERIAASGASCPEGADGCSQFIGALRDTTTGAYLQNSSSTQYLQDDQRARFIKQAPAYLGCYDTNTSPYSVEVNYPTTLQQIENDITKDPRCDAYAHVCLPEEVGCELYTPVSSSGESVPGVVGDNFCPASCVGYNTFRQEKSSFEASVYPLYFIPESPSSVECSAQHVGCDEFTNIGSLETGGEGLEYYTYIKQCEVPDGDNSSVYYSWEGSESQGFVLKVHTLAKVGESTYYEALANADAISPAVAAQFSPNAPVYVDDVPGQLIEKYGLCNEDLYTNTINNTLNTLKAAADCRALYDSSGDVYYRMLADTVTVSEACHPLRKTQSRLVVDEAIIDVSEAAIEPFLDRDICAEKQGYWDETPQEYSLPVCRRCAGGGSWVPEDSSNPEKGSCVYYAIDAPGESVSCIAEANGCRAYTGNSGNNTKPVFDDIFEPTSDESDAFVIAKADWSPANAVAIAAESVQVNLHSLSISGSTEGDIVQRNIPLDAIETGSFYELRFWSRGAVQKVLISLEQGNEAWELTYDPITNSDIPVSIGTSWREYRVGPVRFTGSTSTPLNLVFNRGDSQSSGIYFIDNVSLFRTDDTANLLKDSWKTVEGYDAPVECFATSQDPLGPFPGAALGCEAYTTSLGQTAYATGFEQLCREKAVGCAPLWDTQNTVAPHAEVYNALCSNAVYSGGAIVVGDVDVSTDCTVTVDGDPYNCTIDARESTCVLPGPIRIPSEEFLAPPSPQTGHIRIRESLEETFPVNSEGFFAVIDGSSIYTPADTPADTPLFLTDTPNSACAEKHLGCEVVGLEEQVTPGDSVLSSYEYKEQTVINLPETYLGSQGTLCTGDQVACSAFTTTDGATGYFKDPEANANKLCEYKRPVGASELNEEGWYMKNVGYCEEDESTFCTTNDACGDGDSCVGVGSVPCYADYLADFASYGLWSNGSTEYDGFVGECPEGQNLCTELIDPYDVDTSQENDSGKPYYVIFDNKVAARTDECLGQASLREGCVLFDRTENPNKSYNAAATYAASEKLAADGNTKTLVTPVSAVGNDANELLKVNRGRECSEWLSCETFKDTYDKDGRVTKICSELRACIATDGKECETYAPKQTDPEESFIDIENYINRDTSWFGDELTGYSLYDMYQITDYENLLLVRPEDQGLSVKDVEALTVDTDVFYLGYKVHQTYLEGLGQGDLCTSDNDWTLCGPQEKGRCIEGSCIIPIDGRFEAGTATSLDQLDQAADDLGVALCKVPPEETTPFPEGVVDIGIDDLKGEGWLTRKEFTRSGTKANICQDGNCTCSYNKFTYKDGTQDYWAEPKPLLNTYGICRGNFEKDGIYCTTDSQCKSTGDSLGDGTCKRIESLRTLVGSRGHCLEYDDSRPLTLEDGTQKFACLTWYPVDISMTRVDNFNVFQGAGFDPTQDVGEDGAFSGLYCVNATDPYLIVDTDAWVADPNGPDESPGAIPGGGISDFEIGNWTEHKVKLEEKVLEQIDIYEITSEGIKKIGEHFDGQGMTEYEQMLEFDNVFGPFGSIPGSYIEKIGAFGSAEEVPNEYNNAYYIHKPINSWIENEETAIADRQCYWRSMLGLGGSGTDKSWDSSTQSYYTEFSDDYCSGAPWYPAIQRWAHVSIGETAVVLRAENAATRNTKFGDYFCEDANSCNWNREEQTNKRKIIPRVWQPSGGTTYPMYNFFPRPHHYYFKTLSSPEYNPPSINDIADTSDQNDNLRSIQYLRSFGPMIYPPREWDKATDFSQDTSKKRMESLYTYDSTDLKDAGWSYPGAGSYESGFVYQKEKLLSTNHLSPGPHYTLPDIKNGHTDDDGDDIEIKMEDVLYRSKYEAVLNEYDLDTVHFVPTAYTGGAQKFNPELLNTQISINFNKLRTNADVEWEAKLAEAGDSDTEGDSKKDVLHMTEGADAYFYEFKRVPATDTSWKVDKNTKGCRSYSHGNPGGFGGFIGDLLEVADACLFDVGDAIQCNLNGNPTGYVTETCKSSPNDGAVLSYVIQDDPDATDDGIDLTPQRISSSGYSNEDLDNPRNIVHRRYVTIFFDEHVNGDKGLFAPWIPRKDPEGEEEVGEALPPPSTFDIFADNFAGTNELCYQRRNTNWFAIGMDFNKDGEFLGYLSRSCNDYMATMKDFWGPKDQRDIWENGINMAVVATMNQMCTEFADVYKPGGPIDDTNKAWTNRLWNGADIDVAEKASSGKNNLFLKNKETNINPYGSIALREGANEEDIVTDIAGPADAAVRSLRTYAMFENPESPDDILSPSGVPYACRTPFMVGFASSEFNDDNVGICKYQRYYEDAHSDTVNEFNFPESVEQARQAISMLFAKFYARYPRIDAWDGGSTKAGWLASDIGEEDFGDSFSNYVFNVPQVFSLNPATCFSEDGVCTAGEAHNVTVSGKNGTLTNYDQDENGLPDENPIQGAQEPIYHLDKGSFLANMKFFAMADDNHMPIRSINIDWGDGKLQHNGKKGSYKNKKPFCESAAGHCRKIESDENIPTSLTCQVNGEEQIGCPPDTAEIQYECVVDPGTFGNNPYIDGYDSARFGDVARACEDGSSEEQLGHYSYGHVYSCDAGSEYSKKISDWDSNYLTPVQKNRLDNVGYGADTEVCVFRPGVQVKDNWGWCNGSNITDLPDTLTSVGDNEVVIYKDFASNQRAIASPREDGWYADRMVDDGVGGFDPKNECGYNLDEPWTYYKGIIIVIP